MTELDFPARVLASEIPNGQVVFVLGAGALSGTGLPMGRDLADRLAREAGIEPEGDLAAIAQTAESRLGRGGLVELLSAALSRRPRPSKLLTFLSEIATPTTVFVSTTYDDMLYQALAETGRMPYVVDLTDSDPNV